MFLKCIEMTGFKSFPERTVLHMNGSITGVVGPNGSGKSNVADAIRWVLGEQSPKSLRGSVMQDVIFAGTQTRPPRSYCEVTLIFDNSDARLGNAYSEIQVTRKLYSSGEGEYYLNGLKCRLKDILDMFRDTGVGKEGYSVIGQGRIDEILSDKSTDRRLVLEEASGIMKYRVRKEEAERKLEKTRLNLMRVNDILTEQKLLLEPLKEQAENAAEYLKLAETLKKLEVNMFLHEYASAKSRIERLKAAKEAAQQERDEKELRLKELSGRHSEDLQNFKALESEADALSKVLSAGLAEVQRVEGEIRLCEERLSNIEKDSARIAAEIEETKSRGSAVSESEAENARRISALDGELEILRDAVDEANSELSELLVKFGESAKKIEAARAGRLDAAEKMADIRSEASALREKEESVSRRIDETRKRLEESEKQRAQNEETRRLLEERILGSKNGAAGLLESYNEKILELNGTDAQIARARKELESVRRELDSKRSSAKMLAEMREGFEGYQDSVRRLMLAAKNDAQISKRVIGTVAELIDVPREYETAVEACLGNALQDIIVEDEYDAMYLIDYLRKNEMGRVTFLPLKALKPRSLSGEERGALKFPGVRGAAAELISCRNGARTAIEFLLGRTVFVEDGDTAIRVMREYRHSFRAVTLEGDVFNPGGAVTGGSLRRAGIVSRDRREEELKARCAELSEKAQSMEAALRELEKTRGSIAGETESLRRRIYESELSLTALKEKAQSVTETLKKEEETRAYLEGLLERLSGELETVRKHIETCEARQNETLKSGDSWSEDNKRLEEEHNKNAALIEELKKRIYGAQIQIAEKMKEKAALISDSIRLAGEKAEAQKSLALKKKTLELNAESADNLRRLRDELEATRLQKISAADGISAKLDGIIQRRGSLNEKLSGADEEAQKLRGELGELSEKIMRAEFNIDKAETQIQEAQNRLWDTYQLTYLNALAMREDMHMSEAAARAEEIKRKIREMGPVNPNAIADYNDLKERMRKLTAQKDDLVKAEADLHRLIASLLDEMKKTFKASFEQINKYFGETFKELFDGGNAKLILEDDQNIMECGIEVAAEPPGKKLQKISLLSGGEKALAAISLLFALLKLNPSPVCVLDEIDAALDDANVYKFSEYLKKSARKMQFIVITHKRPTMVICDSLYGFAMEEKGVSKILSVKLD